jgi:signal transduction histidine kinase
VLIVDDEEHMCEVCARTLRRSGYVVSSTTDPHKAVDMLRENPSFDLLLTDIKMPGMTGLELAHIAHECDPTMAVIIMTGFASMEHLHEAVKQGAADFLAKPFELEQLRLAVIQALNKRILLRNNVRLQAFEHLLEYNRELNASLDQRVVAQTFLSEILKQTGCPLGFVLFVQQDQAGPLFLLNASDATAELSDAGYGLATNAFENNETIQEHNTTFATLGQQAFQYALAIPLRAQTAVSGALLLCHSQPIELLPGRSEEVALVTNYASSALRNAHFYHRLNEAYQNLQELDRLKGEFIAVASHELRTPLSIILGYTAMLRDQRFNDPREYAQRILDSAQRIKDIIDDMMSLRHLETSDTRPQLVAHEVQDIIQQLTQHVRPAVEERRQQLHVDLPEQALQVPTDYERLQLVLNHLMSNAIKFTPVGGQITLLVRRYTHNELSTATSSATFAVKRDFTNASSWVIFEVRDTGMGIADRQLPRVFERFYQVADSLTREQGGVGLGLAIVRELVQWLGGMVWVVSREGHGSTFAVALPQ